MKIEPDYSKIGLPYILMTVVSAALLCRYIYTDLISFGTALWAISTVNWVVLAYTVISKTRPYPSLSIDDENCIHFNFEEKVSISDVSELHIYRFSMNFIMSQHTKWADPVKIQTRIYKAKELVEFQKKVKKLFEENSAEQSVAADTS